MASKQQEIAELQEQFRDLEKLRKVLGNTLTDQKKAELEVRLKQLDTGGGAAVAGNVNTHDGDFVGRDKHVYYHGEDPVAKAQQAEVDYRREVADHCGTLPLRGVDATAGSTTAEPLSLAQVYINLDTRLTAPVKAIATTLQLVAAGESAGELERLTKFTEREQQDTRPLAALEAAILYRRLVLLGEPGSGKSTFVNHLTQALANQDWGRLPEWPERERQVLPIPVILRDFARWLAAQQPLPKPCASLLWDFIKQDLHQRELDAAAGPLQQALREGRAVVLLDGLDEVPPDDDLQKLVRDSVVEFAKRYSASRYLLTCRVLSYKESRWRLPAAKFPDLELARFDTDKIDRFIGAWYQEVGNKWRLPSGEPERLAVKLRQAVRRPDLWRLAHNPLLLTVMALVHTHRKELPEKRALLYKDAVDILLMHWEQHKEVDAPQIKDLLDEAHRDFNDLKGVLERLAFEVHAQGGASESVDQATGISESTLLDNLQALYPKGGRVWALCLLETLRLRSSLLLERKGQVFSFPHRTFQEYLAGVHLAHQPNFGQEAGQLAGEAAFWREVILLAVGYLMHHQREQEKPRFLVEALCPERIPPDEQAWRKVWLAGDVLLEMGVNRVQDTEHGQRLLSRVRQQLTALLENGLLTPRERAEAGDVLGQLGDPRFDLAQFYLPCIYRGQPEPLAGFVEIPPGPFVMGSRKGDKGAGENESGNPDKLIIPYPYWIARYPVTVAQFQCFVEANGYEESGWWTRTGWEWRQGRSDSDDVLWRFYLKERRMVELRSAPLGWNEQVNCPNRPVVNICWFEAMAYCCWLDAQVRKANVSAIPLRDGYVIRLPTEAEWEKAARHGDSRRYPWGNEAWDEERANINDSEIGHATPVGMYLKGATPTGLYDAVGNVWEWTLSRYRTYPYDHQDGRDDPEAEGNPVVRGGSWGYSQKYAYCAVRYWYSAVNFGAYCGLRIVLSLANSGF